MKLGNCDVSYLGGIAEGAAGAGAEAEALTGIAAMKSVLIVTVEGMKTEIITMRVEAGGIGAPVLTVGGEEVGAGVQVAGEIEVLLGMVVKRDVLGLKCGTEKEKKQN